VVSQVLAGKAVAMRFLTCSMMSTFIHAAVPASASDITTIGIQLSAMNKKCSSMPNAYVLFAGETAQVCLMRDSIVRTKNGLRYIITYSFANSKGIVDMHDLSWFEVDCTSMMKRKFRDGSIHLVRDP